MALVAELRKASVSLDESEIARMRSGLVELSHVGSRTFMTAEELERLVSGEIDQNDGLDAIGSAW